MSENPTGPIEPDTKDWTWTLERTCPECGITASDTPAGRIAELVAAYTAPWDEVLRRPDVRERPTTRTWSALEYACHVRDVCRLFDERVLLMLEADEPTFANWDQDATAVAERYAEQDPDGVAGELAEAADRLARTYAAVDGVQWERTGVRSNGSRFTVRTLGQYALHDLGHHLVDVGVPVPPRQHLTQ